jgi:hypothetical protein
MLLQKAGKRELPDVKKKNAFVLVDHSEWIKIVNKGMEYSRLLC